MKQIVGACVLGLGALVVCGCGQPAPVAQVTIARQLPPLPRDAIHHEVVAPEHNSALGSDNARNSLKALHAAAEVWRATHGDECPSPQRLKDDKALDPSSDLNDPWRSPYKIVCDDDSTTVVSFGPDGKEGTRDDLRYPDRQSLR